MRLSDAQEMLDYLKSIQGDDEAAHSFEDGFRECVLEAIADGTAENPRELARLALRTGDIVFSRWYA